MMREISSRDVGLTFDPANATSRSLCKSPAVEADVLRFASEFGHRIFIVHYKTTLAGEVQPALGDGDVGSERPFETLAKVFHCSICVEIPGLPTLAETKANVERSFEYLSRGSLARFLR